MRILGSVGCVVVVILALVGWLGGPASAAPTSAQASPAAIPDALVVPPDAVRLFSVEARGVQIYACAEDAEEPGAYTWELQGPKAELLNADGVRIGTHYAGPTWEGNDGSTVVGEVLERAASPDPDAIPWLLLRAGANGGTGVFSTAAYVQRLGTAGGAAPRDGCRAEQAGEELRVDYTATYVFAYPAADLGGTPPAA